MPPPNRSTLEYKGYIAEVSFGDVEDVLHARVINSGSYPIANAEAADPVSLEREFRRSIDVYLESCRELQIDPIAPAPNRIEQLRVQLFDAITDDIWAEAATGFGDPELTSE